jgi:tRNA (adenine57-N1/adenine58-N1)-methyltransferase
VLVTIYNDSEIYSFSNKVGLLYIRNLGNLDTRKITLSTGEIELGSRTFRTRKSTLNDVSSSIERGPQIVLPKDVAQICFELDLPFSSRLLEIGGGAGGFSILAALMYKLRIVSYELDEEYFRLMKRNIARFEVEEFIDANNRDGKEADINSFESIFIDNPEPWNFLDTKLTGDKKVSTILPTYSQAERFSRFLLKKGFLVNVHELIDVPMQLSAMGMRPETSFLYHTGFIVSGVGVNLNG